MTYVTIGVFLLRDRPYQGYDHYVMSVEGAVLRGARSARGASASEDVKFWRSLRRESQQRAELLISAWYRGQEGQAA